MNFSFTTRLTELIVDIGKQNILEQIRLEIFQTIVLPGFFR